MVFAVLLAAGLGTRMKSSTLPKQFLPIGKTSILRHTLDKFLYCPGIDHIIVVVPEMWLKHAEESLQNKKCLNVEMCVGGKTRQESLYRALNHIKERYGSQDDAIIVSHDAARPFVTSRIIQENIKCVKEGSAADTVIKATDTIVESRDGTSVANIPDRHFLYQGQTPQSFRLHSYMTIYESLDEAYLSKVTDAARILVEHGIPVSLVEGEVFNIKITTDYDLKFAQLLAETK